MITRREFCAEIAATAAVATPLALSAEYHGVERLVKMVADDVLLRNFGERACLCNL